MENNVIYNEDCLEGMKKLLDKGYKFDLIITSPPYNIDDFHANTNKYENYNGNGMDEYKYQDWQLELLELMYQLLKDDGALWYNHKVRIKDGKAIHPLEWLFKTNFILKQEIVWNQKKGANVDKKRCFPFSERIYWLTKDSDVDIYNSINAKDVWDIVPTHNRKEFSHPAVMAIEVAKTIYSFYENKDKMLVLDPFAGTGTTFIPLIHKPQWEYVGFELDGKYAKIAKNRLDNENSKMKLFS